MTKKTLHNKLNKQTKEELLGLIIEMQEKFSKVDDYLQSKYSENILSVVKKYKKQITNAIYIDTNNYGKSDFTPAYEAIENFKKLIHKPKELVEILLHFIQCGIQLINDFGDYDEGFYEDMEEYFKEAIELAKSNNLLSQYESQCLELIKKSENTGYGFNEALSDLYEG